MSVYDDASRLSIKAWAEDDRPREKMQLRGRQHLSDAELLAILLGSGSRKETAVGLAQRLLQSTQNNLYLFGKLSLAELQRFEGVGPAKAISLHAAFELGHRRQLAEVPDRVKVTSSRDAFAQLAPVLQDLAHEEFWILLLNRANYVLGRQQVSQGGVSGTVVDAKILFRKAIEGGAASVVLCHNHPSGSLLPSQADLEITRKLKAAGQSLDLPVLDHLIIGGKSYYSFADEGRL